MYKNPLEAYEKVNKATMSGRDVEAAVLTKAALKLKACQDDWNAEDRAAKLDDALRFNQKVWSVFQGELAEKDNPLPIQIKENLFRLGAFVDRRIFETMSFPSPEKLTAVININHNIAAGLRGSGA